MNMTAAKSKPPKASTRPTRFRMLMMPLNLSVRSLEEAARGIVKRRMLAPAMEIATGLIVVSVVFVLVFRLACGHGGLLLHVVMQSVFRCDRFFFGTLLSDPKKK